MHNGFSYRGIHCSDQKCHYIPEPKDRIMLPEIESSGIEVGWRDGGYYYQSKYKIRTFKLRCFFEDATPEDLNRIVLWLSKDSCGKLVFDERKDVYYIVRPTGTTEFSAYPVRHEWMNQDTYSGTFVAVLTAHDPLGFMELTSLSEPSVTTDYTYSGIMDDNMMPSSPSLSDTYFLIYNCGTHPCDMTIDIAGSAPSGLTIRNLSNGTSCKIVGLPSDGTLHIDGQLGKVTVITEGNETDAFDLHDEGYITLSPYENIYRDLLVQTAEGSNALKVSGCPISEGQTGKFIYVEDAWHRITDILDSGDVIIPENMKASGVSNGMITGMNELEISGDDYTLTRLDISYVPRVV